MRLIWVTCVLELEIFVFRNFLGSFGKLGHPFLHFSWKSLQRSRLAHLCKHSSAKIKVVLHQWFIWNCAVSMLQISLEAGDSISSNIIGVLEFGHILIWNWGKVDDILPWADSNKYFLFQEVSAADQTDHTWRSLVNDWHVVILYRDHPYWFNISIPLNSLLWVLQSTKKTWNIECVVETDFHVHHAKVLT